MQRDGSLDSSQHSETTGTLRGTSSPQGWRQQAIPEAATAALPGLGKRMWSTGALPTGGWRPAAAASAGAHPAKSPRLTAAALAQHNVPPRARLFPTDGVPQEALPFVTGVPEVRMWLPATPAYSTMNTACSMSSEHPSMLIFSSAQCGSSLRCNARVKG